MTNSDNGESIFKDLLEKVIGDTVTPWQWEEYIPYQSIKARPVGVYLYDIILFQNVDKAIEIFKRITKSSMKYRFVFGEDQLNSLGYQMIKESKLEAAIKLFELNIKKYPESANVFDSCGEAYMKNGQINLAIENYEKSLELNPNNNNAGKMLRQLRGDK